MQGMRWGVVDATRNRRKWDPDATMYSAGLYGDHSIIWWVAVEKL